MNPRAQAVKILLSILNEGANMDKNTESLTQELCYGTLRWYDQLDYIASQLLKKPFKEKEASDPINEPMFTAIGLCFAHLAQPPPQ